MRTVLAVATIALFMTGCQTAARAKSAPPEERHAMLPHSGFVTLPHLADDLALYYRGDRGSFIELSNTPDSVLFTVDRREVLVNGREVQLGYPCMRRGDEFVVATRDADEVRRTLGEMRLAYARSRPDPLPVVVAPPPRAADDLSREWLPQAAPRAWRYIVIHHMAAPTGSAAVIHRLHLKRGMDGLGYHFVIGNGTITPDGGVEVGYRWRRQTHGAHARVRAGDDNRWNEYGIGICLVGDFRYTAPSPQQMESLVRLVRGLRSTYGIRVQDIVPHAKVKPTICPGPRFPWGEFISRVAD